MYRKQLQNIKKQQKNKQKKPPKQQQQHTHKHIHRITYWGSFFKIIILIILTTHATLFY